MSDRGYFSDEFKKEIPPTFDVYVKKPKDEKAWILWMNKLFELHEDTYNMKAIITIFNLKGKEGICWEDVKWVRYIRTYDLSWWEFKRLLRKKYLS